MRQALIRSIDPSRPAGPQIFEALKFAILWMELAPGQILSESEIAEQCGASRTPVREALLQLRQVGLLTTQPSRGHFVTRLSKASILEARFLREAIEVANVERICDITLSPQADEALQDNLLLQEEAVVRHDEHQFSELDDQFHSIIAKATGFPRVSTVLEREKVPLDRLRVLCLNNAAHMRSLHNEHSEIYAALQNHDADKAINATRLHLQSVLDALSALMDRHAEYFEEDRST